MRDTMNPEGLLLRRVSDAGHHRRSQMHRGRRLKASRERTRGMKIAGFGPMGI
jgi:hypothetical protein